MENNIDNKNTEYNTQEDAKDKSFKEKASEFLNANGFFVVAGLCVVCIGIAVAASLIPKTTPAPAPTPIAVEQTGHQASTPAPTQTPLPEPTYTPVVEPLPASAPAVNESEEPAEEKSAPAASIQKAPAPVDGDVIWGFAVDTLLYSKTLELWTTHEGIDIAAKDGTAVKSIKAGKVIKVYEDDALGVSVKVEHEGGLVSLYANLAQKPPVSEGQLVNTGDTIGYVGATAASECALESHLHFALYKDAEAVEPSKYVLVG